MKIATNLFTPKPAPYFPSTRGLVSNMSSSNSTIVKIAKLPIVVILSPIAFLLDVANAAARPFIRKVQPLTFKEKAAIVANKSGSEMKKAAKIVKEKASNAASKAKDFAEENPAFVKVTAATVATIGAAYLYKNMTKGNCPPFWKDIDGQCVRLKDYIRNLNPTCPAESNGWKAWAPSLKQAGGSALGLGVTAALGIFGYKKYQESKATGAPVSGS